MRKQKNEVNIFTSYAQKENNFTNGLISILKLGNRENSDFVSDFVSKIFSKPINDTFNVFQVLQNEQKSTADATLAGNRCYFQFETKIESATLRAEQIKKHLKTFKSDTHKIQSLILLTPDDANSNYIQDFVKIDKTRIQHLEWKHVYNYLEKYIQTSNKSVFAAIVQQYLDLIGNEIFKQDIVGIIQKIAFNDKTGVDKDKYLDEMNNGQWKYWNTPKELKQLVGTGRKLLLYDTEKKAITVEAEIAKVKKTNREKDFTWSNIFAPGKLIVYEHPISLSDICKVDSFANYGGARNAYRNLTHEQYKSLRVTPA
ncbi:PD-(D/E)XK nuclease family protein [bacterium]|nr:PD-(D/E)XK nuclease family protein [bacterium]